MTPTDASTAFGPANEAGFPPTVASRSPSARTVVAELTLRIAQLNWPVSCDVERNEIGEEVVALTRLAVDGSTPTGGASRLRVEAASLGRPHLVRSILEEIRARGWNRAPSGGMPRDEVRWCAPA